MLLWSVLLAIVGIAGVTGGLSAQSQERPQVTVIPTLAVGGMQRTGPQFYAGGQVRVRISSYIAGVVQGSRWTVIAACADAVEDNGCSSGGYNADAGLDLHGSDARLLRPYVGTGIGVMSAHTTASALNTRVGIDIGQENGVSLHLEARAQRAFGALDAAAGIVTIGLAFGL